MKNLSVLIKPTSSICNLRCSYCFYLDETKRRHNKKLGFMNEKDAKILVDRAFDCVEEGGHIAFNFQGGEPSLIGLDFYKAFIDYVNSKEKNIIISYTLQTNGILIDEMWAKFLRDNNFLVGLSIDGDKDTHDSYRKNIKGEDSFKSVLKAKSIFDSYDVDYNVLTVLTKKLSKKANDFYAFIKREGINYLQIIPCLSDFDQKTEMSIDSINYYRFHKEIFDMWIEDLDKGIYVSIKIFDDIINFLLYGQLGFCGMGGFCSNQNVIESNLDIYPCDFYALDSYKLGNLKSKSFDQIYQSSNLNRFIKESKQIDKLCHTCPYVSFCNGGCRRMKSAMYIDPDNNTFCAYKNLVDLVFSNIERIKKDIFHIRSQMKINS